MAQYLNNPSSTSIDCGTADINTGTASKTFTIAWCNVPAMGYSITGTDKDLFSVSVANNSEAGKYNTATYTVTYDHNKRAGSHSATLTITDSYGNYSKTVSLSGVTNKLTPTVTWSPNDDIFNVDDVLTATNANDLAVTLSSAGNESFISCSGNTATMLSKTSGKITVTAHVTGNDLYADKDITKEITITNLEKQYITWTQDFSRLRTTDGTKSITLNATSSSGLAVTYELSGDKTGLSLTQSGSAWILTYSATECKNTTIIAHQTGNTVYAPASSVSVPVKVIDPTKVCDMSETLVNSQISLKSSSVTYNIDIPASMTVSFSRMKTGLLDIYLQGLDVEFYSGRNGTGSKLYTKQYTANDINKSLSNSTIDLSSYISAKSVKITTAATNGYYIDGVTYTHRKYCTVSKNSLSFETFPNTTTSAQTFNVNYANYPIYIECSNNKFTVTPTEFGDCSEYGTQAVSVQYTATAGGTDNGTIYVKDNTGTTLQTVTLSVTINKLTQNITSTTVASTYNTTDKITLSAESNSGETDFVYSATPAGIAVFNGSEMTFTQSGIIAVTVTQPGTDVYAPASTTINNVKVNKVTPTIAANPDVATLRYLDNFDNSLFSGGLATVTLRSVANTPVAGTFTWTNAGTQVTDEAGEHNYSVTFTPTDGGMYNPVTFTMPVTISRATTPTLEYNNTTVGVSRTEMDHYKTVSLTDLIAGLPATHPMAAADINYSVKSVSTEGTAFTGSAATTETAVISNTAKTFYATEVGVYTLTASAPQTNYYDARDVDFTITVEKLQPQIYFSYEDTVYNVRVVKNAAIAVCENETIATPVMRYTSSDESVIKEQPNAEGMYQLVGIVPESDEAVITARFAGNAYFLPAENQKTYFARAKFTPIFLIDGTDTQARTLNVTGTAQASFHYCLPYDDDTKPMTYDITPVGIIEYNPATQIITAVGEGVAKLTFVQGTDAYRYEGSREFTFTISRNATSLTLAEQVQNAGSMYVGDQLSGTLYTTNTNEVPVTFASTNTAVVNLVDGKLCALQEGDATITFSMTPEGAMLNKWIPCSQQKTIHVSKRGNTLTADHVSLTKSYGGSEVITFTSSNTDYANYPISLTATSNADLVVITRTADNAFRVIARHTEGTATLRATQEASNEYVESTLNGITFTVGKSSYHVPIDLNASKYNDTYCRTDKGGTCSASGSTIVLGSSDGGGTNWDEKYVVFKFEGIPDKLTFGYKCYVTGLAVTLGLDDITNAGWYVQESVDGNFSSSTWTSSKTHKDNYESVTVPLKPDTRYVKLCYSGNYSGQFNNIHISERSELCAAEPATTSVAPYVFESKPLGSDDSEMQFVMDWYNIDQVSVTSSDNHFSVAPSSFADFEDYGQQVVTVVYHRSSDVGVHQATITATNGTQTRYIYVQGETTKKTATITWHSDIEGCGFLMNPAEVYPSEAVSYVARLSNGGEYTLSSDNASVISVSGTTLTANALGTAKITVRYAGSGDFYAAETSQVFTVTNDTKQTIDWNQNFMGLKLGGAAVGLTATASSGGAITYTIEEGGSSIVTVAGSTMTIAGTAGDTYITATQQGCTINDITYAPISMTKRVHVGDPNLQCTDSALNVLTENEYTFSSTQQSTAKVYTLEGPAANRVYFSAYHDKASGTFWDNFEAIGSKNYGPLIVEEYRNNNNTWEWHEIFRQVVNKESYANYSAAVDPTTTKLRFYSNEEVAHHISNISLRRRKVLESSETSISTAVDCNVLYTKTIRITYAGLDVLTASVDGGFSLDKETIGEGCGTYGTEEITVSLTPTELKTYTGTLTITDGKNSETKITIPLSVEAQPISQTIIDFNAAATYQTTDQVTFTASVLSGNTVYYTSSDESIATVDAAGVMTIYRSGEAVTITAHCDAAGVYAAAPDVERTFAIEKVTPVVSVAPTASRVYVPATLAESDIDATDAVMQDDKGNTVSGSFEWKSAVEAQTGTNGYTAVFTPDNTDWYNTAEVTVMVEAVPRDKHIVWSLADNSTYYCYEEITLDGYTVDDLTGATVNTLLTYATDDPEVATVNGVGKIIVNKSGTVTITATSAAAGYYAEAPAMQRTITFLKTTPVIEQAPKAIHISIGQKLERSYFFSYKVVREDGEIVSGNFVWDDPEHAENIPGIYTFPVHFVPNNASYYDDLATEVSVRVVYDFWTFDNTKDPDNHTWGIAENWSNAAVPMELTPDVTVIGNLFIEADKNLSSVLIEEGASVTITNNAEVTVKYDSYLSEYGTYGDLIVEQGGKLNLETTLNVHDFILRSTPTDEIGVGHSGQITTPELLNIVDGDIYFELFIPAQENGLIDEDASFGFAVPFPVSIATGDVKRWNGTTWETNIEHLNQFAVAYYYSPRRAAGANGWRLTSGTVLYPGNFYMLGVDSQASRYRFRKVADAPFQAEQTMDVQLYSDSRNANVGDRNWNAIANPNLLYSVTTDAPVQFGYIFLNGTDAYKVVRLDTENLAVGTPFFVQTPSPGTVTVTPSVPSSVAPRRAAQAEVIEPLAITFAADNDPKRADRIFLQASEDAEDAYELGHDLSKFATSASIPQLWIEAYGKRLGVNEARLQDGEATFPIALSAPKNGTYRIAIEKETNAETWLMCDGNIVWNLSDGAYTVDLAKGVNRQYVVILRYRQPSVVTDLDETQQGKGTVRKFVRNGQLYILRDGVLYDSTGKKINIEN